MIQISNRFKELPVYWISFSFALESTSMWIFSFRYHASFLPFRTFLKHSFQPLILQTVNFRCLLNFVHLPKIYDTLRFMDSIQLCFWHTNSHEEGCYHYRMWLRPMWLRLDTKFVKRWIGHSLAILTMFSTKVETVFICLSNSQTLSRYQKSIGKRQNHCSKMWKGIWSL